jgi:dephospho-CoA kinase
MVVIVGLTGRNSAGKDSVADVLEMEGFERWSLSDVLREELRRRGEEITRPALIALGNELRRAEGPAVLAKRMTDLMRTKRVCLVSVRSPAEVEELRKHEGFVLVAVEAPPEVRFERERARGRESAPQTLETFLELEARENTTDENAQQLDATCALADAVIVNDGTLDELRMSIVVFLERIDDG